MYQINYRQRQIGMNMQPDKITVVCVWAPEKKILKIETKKNKIISLHQSGQGYWKTSTDEFKTGDEYKFLIDGEAYPDPASLSQPHGVHNHSAIVDLNEFKWTDAEWRNIPLGDYIIYELHTGTFSIEGNFNGIISHLDYLLDLGINAVEIMPIAQFPGKKNWGYDGVYPFAVQNSYGGSVEFQKLVNECHRKGIAVILDVVYNHLGPEGNYLGKYAHYFTDKYKTPWGMAINFDDEWSDGVRNYFSENVLMWFRDFHIDALRMDAIHAIKDFSPVHILSDLKMHVNQLMQITGKNYYLLVESDLNDPRFIEPIEQNGCEMDAQWNDDFHHSVHVASTGENAGYYSDYNGSADLAKSFQDGFVYDGKYSFYRKKTFGRKLNNLNPKQLIVFSQNHDQIGNRKNGDRIGHQVNLEMIKLVSATVILSPFIPLLFMGEEWNCSSPFQYFVDHSDSSLVEAVRRGRREEFKSFQEGNDIPDPFDESTFRNSRLRWEELEKNTYQDVHSYYRKIILLRKKINSIPGNDDTVSSHYDDINEIVTIKKVMHQNVFHLLLFYKNAEIKIPRLPDWNFLLLNSSGNNWKNSDIKNISGEKEITIYSQSALLFSENV
jgi:maltooligosyltrehalose trehalohydrolase